MKRLFLLIVVVMLVYWVWAPHRRAIVRPVGPPGHRTGPILAEREARRHMVAKAGHEVQQAFQEAEQEFREAVHEVRDEAHRAVNELHAAFVSDDADDADQQQPSGVEREDAEGIPVRIVPGTRVTEAQPVPPVPARPAIKARRFRTPRGLTRAIINTAAPEIPTLDGQISATPERAEADARVKLGETITAWLEPEVPRSWSLPAGELDKIVLGLSHEPVQKDYGTLYITHLKLDTTPAHRARLVAMYNHELVSRRLVNLGSTLAFILICLAAVSGYIRADEATKGYYTNRLRLLAAAGVGAGGVLIYQMVT